MRILTLEIIVWIIGSVYFILTPHLASSTLAGNDYSICENNVTETKVQKESYTKWGWQLWKIIFYYGPYTESRLVNKTIQTREQICCPGFTNVNQICLPKNQTEPCREGCNWCFSKNCTILKPITNQKKCLNIFVKNNPAPENDPCNHNKNCTASRIKPCLPECAPECNETGWCTNETVCACHSNFKIDENGTNCVPLCDNECKHGNCVAKNKCNCTEGWEGDSCDVPFLCRLFENDEKNSMISDNSTNISELPICHSGCRENINGTMTILGRSTILINSTCNTEVMGFLIKYGPWIFLTSVLVVLVCFITCIACCIKKMKKSVDSNYGLELIPSTTTNHMEENDLYATTKTTF